MRKLTSLLFLITFFVFLLILTRIVAISAQPQGEDNNLVQEGYQLSSEIDDLRSINDITNSTAYTIYLPIIYVPPPFNPKKGVGVIASPACADLEDLRASWYLNWKAVPDATCGADDKDKFVPRISNEAAMGSLSVAISNAQASGWLLGFNEPNLSTQANMTPAQGAVLWKQIEDAAIPAGIKLVSPAPNQFSPGQADPYGYQWLWAMVDEYQARYNKKPHFDAIGWNIYGYNITSMKSFLIRRHQEAQNRGYNVPIWVVEYSGCLTFDSGASDRAVMKAITAWFDQKSWIDRYAWFSNRKSSSYQGEHNCILINNNNTLTTLGQIYKPF